MKYRPLVPLAAAAVAATVLAGCDTKVGAAATVGSNQIRESQVGRYLTDKAKPIPVQGGTLIPRSYALQALILEDLLNRSLAAHGGVPSAAAVRRAEAQLEQGRPAAQLASGYTRYGFKAKMAEFDYRVHALEAVLAARTGSRTYPALVKVVNGQHIPVSVSPRYGAWDPTSLSISTSARSGVPPMVSLQPSAATQP